MEPNDRLGKDAQTLLIGSLCAIVRMENKYQEGTDAFRFAAGKVKHFLDATIANCSSEGQRDDFRCIL
jgi:hypothetical protein